MTSEQEQRTQNVAVVGSGIAGLASALCLAQQGCKVTLFEREDRLGGHSLTFPGEGDRPPVDLGFQVMNNTTYPYLTSLFDSLGVDTEPSDMSFAFSVDDGRVEWSSDALFAQPGNARDPAFLYMLREIFRFANATEVLDENKKEEFDTMTLGEYLDLRGYSERFRSDYILPTTAAIWSVPNGTMEQHPVKPLVAFMANHHLLAPLGERPRWRVVAQRSEAYVDAIAKELERLGASIQLEAAVKAVRLNKNHGNEAKSGGCRITFEQKGKEDAEANFDHVILASHSDVSARILGDGDAEAPYTDLVKRVRYQPNRVILHSDVSQMPRERAAWASWNVLDKRASPDAEGSRPSQNSRDICVTYWLNHLQNLPESAPLLLCTLNPISEPDADKVIFETTLDHPVFDTAAMDAQRQINKAQAQADAGSRSLWFAGAWLGSGFHEDGIRSALAVCKALAGSVPRWAVQVGAPEHPGLQLIRGPSPSKSVSQRLGLQVFQAVASRGIKRGHLVMMLPDGNDLHFGRESAADAKSRGEPTVRMRIQDLGMLAKCVAESDIGLGEAYMHRMFDVDDLPSLFDVLIVNNQTLRETLNPLGLSANSGLASFAGAVMYCIGNIVEHIRHLGNDNTVTGSRRNIEAHYDAGNSMYKLFLDDTLTYSCGLHRREYGAENAAPGEELPLYEAQLAKLDSIIRKADLKSSDHVLEIGCGWGSFAIRAASTVGCRVTGITISTEQLAEAQARVRAAGLEDKVNLMIFDYRKMGVPQRTRAQAGKKNTGGETFYEQDLAPGHFDKIVSIEMLEAVGHDHLPEYFETVDRMLKPGGRAVIQVISIKDDRYEEYRRTSDFIRRYIFPGGHMPCEASIRWASEETDLLLGNVDDIGPDYAVTLRMWRENFVKNRDAILALGYPETFFRCFEMYFAYCEAGFAQKYIHNYHLTFTKDEKAKSAVRAEEREAESAARYNRTVIPAVLAIMALIASLSLTLNPLIREVMSILCSALLFTSLIGDFLPRINPAMDTTSRRATRFGKLVGVRLAISLSMCVIVAGLIAFHEVLYTTRLAGSDAYMSFDAENVNSEIVADDTGFVNNLSEGPAPVLHFCNWQSAESSCQRPANAVAAAVSTGVAEATGKLYVRSPMHFVVGCLAFASVSRFLLERNLMNALHALALMMLSVLSLSSNAKMSTSALGLAIVHGASELHASISAARTLLGLRGLMWNDSLYRRAWSIDISSMLIIRWVPVPVLLSPVILRAPWPVLLAICMIAVRETSVLIDTLLALKEDYENRLNAADLLDQARNRDEIVNAMVGTALEAAVLEVSNTPWLQKRMYVLPFFDDDDDDCKHKDDLNEKKRVWRSKWKKDFHVSPFFDVFFNYEWVLNLPREHINIRALSTRRDPETDGADEAPARKDEPWTQVVGTAPTDLLQKRNASEQGDEESESRTFIVNLNLQRASASERWRQLLHQPLMTFSIVLYIHVHAFIVMVRKGCAQKLTPRNAPGLGLGDAARHLLIFTIAGLAGIWRILTAPFVKTRAQARV
ncbi:Sphingolipid C9-methyltransferase [Hondaea fermentalgiana]|uniref:Sphingolipid C9-methyltransferase n=1 Tax=Hondaea fermentalgiana TaxID=2315210 RepID=A0A2R5G335_9STRA|nr:Sphingolipid C9-methyltransferase [Hondaea fermentalgiana]|eukprot:GBG24148.1 Sphingolipid C9-methyltransferase [Hondaea fermentalgiana]